MIPGHRNAPSKIQRLLDACRRFLNQGDLTIDLANGDEHEASRKGKTDRHQADQQIARLDIRCISRFHLTLKVFELPRLEIAHDLVDSLGCRTVFSLDRLINFLAGLRVGLVERCKRACVYPPPTLHDP